MNLDALSIRGIRVTLLFSVVRILVQMAIIAVLARLIAAEDYGLVAGALAIVGVVQHILTSGPERAVLLTPDVTPANLQAALWFVTLPALAASAALAGGAALAAMLGAPPRFAAVLAALAPLIALTAPAAVFRGALRRRFAFLSLSIVETIAQIVGTGVISITAAAAGAGAFALVLGLLGQGLLQTAFTGSLAVGAGLLRIGRPTPGMSAGPLVSASVTISRTSILEVLHAQSPSALIGAMLGATSLGLYNRAAAIIAVPVELIVSAITRVLIGTVGASRHDQAVLRQLCGDLVETVAAVSVPICVGAAVAGPLLAATILGPGWEEAGEAVAWLSAITACAMVGHAIGGVNEGLLRHHDRFRIQVAVTVASAVGLAAGATLGLAGALAGLLAGSALFVMLHLGLAASALAVPRSALLARLVPGASGGLAAGMAALAVDALRPGAIAAPAALLLQVSACAAAVMLLYAALFPRVLRRLLGLVGLHPGALAIDPDGRPHTGLQPMRPGSQGDVAGHGISPRNPSDGAPAAKPIVVHVLGPLEASGAERLLEALAPACLGDVTAVIVSTGTEGIGPFGTQLESAGYRIRHVPFRRTPGFVWRMSRQLASLGPDVLHIHCERAALWIALAGRATTRARIVRTIHGVFPFSGGLRLRRAWHRWLMRKLLGVGMIAVSNSVARNEAERFRNPAVVVGTWIDTARFAPPSLARRAAARAALGLSPRQTAIALVGSCQEVKNHGAAVAAVSRLCADGHDVVLLHAGTGPLETAEKAEAMGLGIGDRVRFLGVVPAVEDILHAADVFLMPSLREGLGVAAIEALSVGLPAVLTDVDGLRDVAPYSRSIRWSAPDPVSLSDALAAIMATDSEPEPADPGLLAQSTPDAGWARLRQIYMV